MKKYFLLFVLLLSACHWGSKETSFFYERTYALPVEARQWAKQAPLQELCEGTKNWRIESIQEASLNEIYERGIDTRQCFYLGLELTP